MLSFVASVASWRARVSLAVLQERQLGLDLVDLGEARRSILELVHPDLHVFPDIGRPHDFLGTIVKIHILLLIDLDHLARKRRLQLQLIVVLGCFTSLFASEKLLDASLFTRCGLLQVLTFIVASGEVFVFSRRFCSLKGLIANESLLIILGHLQFFER